MNVQNFLKDIGFVQSWHEIEPFEESFVMQMQAGLEGQDSTIPMIPAYISIDHIPSADENVIALDAGGTNLRVALLHIKPGSRPEILYMHKQRMPGTYGEMKSDAFFDAIAQAVMPVAKESSRIGFCFSFPCIIRSDLDGEIICFDKEVNVSGCNHLLVGENLRKALKRLGINTNHKIVILNDTVTTLLGALAENPVDLYGGFIGCVLGTGMNCCYTENNQRIIKNKALNSLTGKSIINTECGSFGSEKMILTPADEYVRNTSKDQDGNLLEKMISGAYQGKVLDGLIKAAAETGLFTDKFIKRFTTGISSEDIGMFLALPNRSGTLRNMAVDEHDVHVLYELTDAVVERAAILTVMSLTSVMRFADIGKDPLRPVCIAIEGTTYEKNEILRDKIHTHMIYYTQKICGYHTRVVSTPNANLIGASVAALTR